MWALGFARRTAGGGSSGGRGSSRVRDCGHASLNSDGFEVIVSDETDRCETLRSCSPPLCIVPRTSLMIVSLKNSSGGHFLRRGGVVVLMDRTVLGLARRLGEGARLRLRSRSLGARLPRAECVRDDVDGARTVSWSQSGSKCSLLRAVTSACNS